MQTWLVNMRHPIKFFREVRSGGLVCLHLFIGGAVLSGLAYPFMMIPFIVWVITRTSALKPFIRIPFFNWDYEPDGRHRLPGLSFHARGGEAQTLEADRLRPLYSDLLVSAFSCGLQGFVAVGHQSVLLGKNRSWT